MQAHPISPIYNEGSQVLILGSFPSVRSRKEGFFYGHKQNRFWKMLSSVLNASVPETVDEKKKLLTDNGIALWDVIASCEISGSADSSIKNAEPNDISVILGCCDIRAIITNGKKASEMYRRYIFPKTGIEDICLPSTSPANASFSLDRLIKCWGDTVLHYL